MTAWYYFSEEDRKVRVINQDYKIFWYFLILSRADGLGNVGLTPYIPMAWKWGFYRYPVILLISSVFFMLCLLLRKKTCHRQGQRKIQH